jgi:hypothetical protein
MKQITSENVLVSAKEKKNKRLKCNGNPLATQSTHSSDLLVEFVSVGGGNFSVADLASEIMSILFPY